MEKLDLRKVYKHLYQPIAKTVSVVDVPTFNFVMMDGKIEPGCSPGTSPSFKNAVELLYGISYTLKFMVKQREEDAVDYSVMPLEALWWVEDGKFDITKPDNWFWRAMIMQPEPVTETLFKEGLEKLKKKKANTAIEKVRLESFAEGLSIQIMHIGPYADEPTTVQKMDAFAAENGYQFNYQHHEIYLGDPLRTEPSKLKTILRHGVVKK